MSVIMAQRLFAICRYKEHGKRKKGGLTVVTSVKYKWQCPVDFSTG